MQEIYWWQRTLTYDFTRVRGPDGGPLSLSDLPPSKTRWTPNRKAKVVIAVQAGLLSLKQARKRYALSFEEFIEWRRGFTNQGLKGLRSTSLEK